MLIEGACLRCLHSDFQRGITIPHLEVFLGIWLFNGRRIYPSNKGLRIYGGVCHPPFDTLKVGTSTDDIKLKLYR